MKLETKRKLLEMLIDINQILDNYVNDNPNQREDLIEIKRKTSPEQRSLVIKKIIKESNDIINQLIELEQN